MKNLLTIIFFAFSISLFAQSNYQVEKKAAIPLAAEEVFGNNTDSYFASIEPVKLPSPIPTAEKKFLAAQKRKSERLFPRKDVLQKRSALPDPEIFDTFSANNWETGAPLDNHLAYSNDGLVVSVVNTHMLVMNSTGVWKSNRELNDFFKAVTGNSDRVFDPRIMYDPQADRWIMVMMEGFDCTDTQLLFAFSKTSNASGGWNLYSLDGCPFLDMTFADYPMISLVGEDLFFTYNGVRGGEPWQTGFAETIIWQIDKQNGYDGDALTNKLWSNIRTDGRPIRNLCPVKNSTEELPENAFFLSNRNFDVENDSIFVLQITGDVNDDNAELLIDIVKSDQPYGVPPNALQTLDSLQTNDARVLDAFLLGDHIQFVGNTIDFNSGRPAVYHGQIEDVYGNKIISGQIIGSEDDLGYPGLAYVGATDSERDVIIVASHASEIRNPGFSALYADGFGERSNWVTVKEGKREIDMFQNFTLERWGDYCGVQRDYLNPEFVYAAASYGKSSKRNDTWIGKISRPQLNVSTKNKTETIAEVSAFPNPTSEWVDIKISLDQKASIVVLLLDNNGKLIDQVIERNGLVGDQIIHFNTKSLSAGTYLISVLADKSEIVTKLIIVE